MDGGYRASQFALAGGNIKNSVLTAAFEAASQNSAIARRHLVRAVSQELGKMDQPVVRDRAVTTSTGPGTAVEVALALLEQLTDRANVDEIRHLMGFPVPDWAQEDGVVEEP